MSDKSTYTNIEKYNTPGLHYFRADLECHTARDPHWKGRGIDQTYSVTDFAKEFVARCREARLDVVGVTDHNFGRPGVPEVIKPIRDEARRHESTGYKLTVFPGFEVSTRTGKQGFQLLCLFPPETAPSTVSDFLTTCCGLEQGERFDKNNCVRITPDKHSAAAIINDVVNVKGGVVIIPSGSYKAFHEEVDGENLKDLWMNEDILALTIGGPVETLPSRKLKQLLNNETYRRVMPITPVWTSDGKTLSGGTKDVSVVGSRYSWIKMDIPTIESLRQAFLDGESRVRLQDSDPAFEFPQITNIEVTKAGFLNDIHVSLNPQLNCLIGGRGSGKSTIIEYIRFALGRMSTREETSERDFSAIELWRNAKSLLLGNGDKQGTLTSDTVLRVGFRKDGKEYMVERTQTESHIYEISDGTTVERPDIGNVRLFFPVKVLSQHQIHAMAMSPGTITNLIDEFLGDELVRVRDREKEKRLELMSIGADLDKFASIEEEIRDLETRLADLGVKVKRLQERGWTDVVQLHLSYEKEREYIDELTGILANLSDNLTMEEYEDITKPPQNTPNVAQLLKWRELVDAQLKKTTKAVAELRQEVDVRVTQLNKEIESKWEPALSAAEEKYEQSKKEMSIEGDEEEAGTLLEQLLKDQKILRAKLRGFQEARERISTLQKQRGGLLRDLYSIWKEEWELRSEKAAWLTSESIAKDFVLITVRSKQFQGGNLADYENVIKYVEQNLAEKLRFTYSSLDDFHILAEAVVEITNKHTYGPSKLAEAIRRDKNALEKQGDLRRDCTLAAEFKLTPAKAKRLAAEIGEGALRELEEWRLPEEIIVRVKQDRRDRVGRSLQQVSDGQRATAVLGMVLAEGDIPIIIDQPEDDLDNDFIYQNVVTVLRGVKQKRQLIIATHNANIPVNGDCELLMALSVENGRGRIRQTGNEQALGAIDRQPVKEAVTDIMEGGKDAFHRRRMKYNF